MSPRVIPVATSCHDSFATLPHASSVTTRFWRTSAEPQSSTAIISEPTPVRPEKSTVGRYSSLLLSLLLSGILAIISTSAFSCTVFSSLIRFSFSSRFTLSTLATVVAVASFGCRSFGKKTPQLLLLSSPSCSSQRLAPFRHRELGHPSPILTACRYTPMGAPCNSLDYVCCRCHLSPQHEVGGLWQG